jgi:hypothetical protein
MRTLKKDIDSSIGTNSSNMSLSNIGENLTQLPAIDINPQLHHMDSVDDIDEDEAFISELMALHPNDEDIIVEDIEFSRNDNDNDADRATQETASDDNNVDDDKSEDGVRELKKTLESLVARVFPHCAIFSVKFNGFLKFEFFIKAQKKRENALKIVESPFESPNLSLSIYR